MTIRTIVTKISAMINARPRTSRRVSGGDTCERLKRVGVGELASSCLLNPLRAFARSTACHRTRGRPSVDEPDVCAAVDAPDARFLVEAAGECPVDPE